MSNHQNFIPKPWTTSEEKSDEDEEVRLMEDWYGLIDVTSIIEASFQGLLVLEQEMVEDGKCKFGVDKYSVLIACNWHNEAEFLSLTMS